MKAEQDQYLEENPGIKNGYYKRRRKKDGYKHKEGKNSKIWQGIML